MRLIRNNNPKNSKDIFNFMDLAEELERKLEEE